MFVYLVESFAVLLVAAAIFFTLGTGFGYVLWGRFRKMIGEWKQNAERQSTRMRALEEEIDRSNIIYADLEFEKNEILDIFATRNKEYAHMEELLDEAITMRDEADNRIDGRDGAIAARDREIIDLRVQMESMSTKFETNTAELNAELSKRHALVEALNERIESVSLDRDNRISILKTRLLAAEQERDNQKNELNNMTTSLQSGSRPKATAARSSRAAKRNQEQQWQPVKKLD
jgi:chromosome segregation ATPase